MSQNLLTAFLGDFCKFRSILSLARPVSYSRKFLTPFVIYFLRLSRHEVAFRRKVKRNLRSRIWGANFLPISARSHIFKAITGFILFCFFATFSRFGSSKESPAEKLSQNLLICFSFRMANSIPLFCIVERFCGVANRLLHTRFSIKVFRSF